MHNIKFSANKAFYILSQIYSNETKISIVELTKKLELSQLTVLKFVSKMENRIARMKLLNDGQMPDPNDFLGSNDIVVGKE
jgi:hypothetical protein